MYPNVSINYELGSARQYFKNSGFSETLYSQYLSLYIKIVVSVNVSPKYISFIDC